MGTEYNLISTDAQRALEEFAEDFAAALVNPGVQEWAKQYGLYKASRALKTTYPIPVSAAGYSELVGDLKYRSIYEKSLELKPKTWQDGVAELASVIEAPDFVGWTTEPAAMAAAATSLLNGIVAALLEANGTCWDGKAFFANDHPVNVFDAGFGTYDNLYASGGALTPTTLSSAKTAFRKLKGPNGKPAGLKLTHLLIPPALEETALNIRDRSVVVDSGTVGAVDNLQKGSFDIIVSDELTSDTTWYPLALNKPGMKPWIVQDEGAPEEIRRDKTSDYYKSTLKVSIAYVLRGNAALALPNCVQCWTV